MSEAGVWETFPRVTWTAWKANEDSWTDQLEQLGVVVIVDEDGQEVDVLGASWWLLDGLAAIAPMPILRAGIEARFPAVWEAEQVARNERFAQWRG